MDTLTMIQNEIDKRDKRYKVMDRTRDRVYNTPYVMTKLDGKTPLDDVINVTMPYAPIIANTVINDIMESFLQVVIEGDISATQNNYIEGFLRDNREETDEILRKLGFPPLFEWWSNHVCIRSYIGVRWVSQIVDGQYVIDCLPVDMRYTPYEYGNDGKNWVANITYRSESEIRAEYSKELEKKGHATLQTTKLDIKVTDFWSTEKNEVYIDGVLIRTQKNPFGEPPFVISAPATGFMLRDKGYIEHESEDILFLIRDVLDEINRSVSIEQTIGFELIRPPYVEPVEKKDGKPARQPPVTGQTKNAKQGEEWKLLEKPDVNNAFLTGREDIMKIVQMGGVNDIDLGNVSQTVSAVWITAQAGIRKKFSNPRLKAIAQADQMLARMMIDQAKKAVEVETGSPELLIGRRGRKVPYSAEKLGDPDKYDILYEYRTQSNTEEIANLTQFEAAPDLPYEWKLEHILKADDPQAIIRMKDFEEAKVADPAIGLSEMGVSLAREAAEVEDEQEADLMKLQSMMLIERAVALLKQRLQPAPETPETTPPTEKPRGNSQALMALPKLLQGQRTGGAPRQPREAPAS